MPDRMLAAMLHGDGRPVELEPEVAVQLIEEMRALRAALPQDHPHPEHDLAHFVCTAVYEENGQTVVAYEPLRGFEP